MQEFDRETQRQLLNRLIESEHWLRSDPEFSLPDRLVNAFASALINKVSDAGVDLALQLECFFSSIERIQLVEVFDPTQTVNELKSIPKLAESLRNGIDQLSDDAYHTLAFALEIQHSVKEDHLRTFAEVLRLLSTQHMPSFSARRGPRPDRNRELFIEQVVYWYMKLFKTEPAGHDDDPLHVFVGGLLGVLFEADENASVRTHISKAVAAVKQGGSFRQGSLDEMPSYVRAFARHQHSKME